MYFVSIGNNLLKEAFLTTCDGDKSLPIELPTISSTMYECDV